MMYDMAGVVDSVRRALAELPADPKDLAARALADLYAQEIDAGKLADFGPKLLAVLEALTLTPRARAVALKGGKPDAPSVRTELDELRQRRAARLADAAPMDSAAT